MPQPCKHCKPYFLTTKIFIKAQHFAVLQPCKSVLLMKSLQKPNHQKKNLNQRINHYFNIYIIFHTVVILEGD